MRYDNKVIFLDLSPEKYDPETGGMVRNEIWKGQKMCSVHDLSTHENVTLLGRIDAAGLALHHKGRQIEANIVVVRGKRYRIRTRREISMSASYIVEELMGE